MSLPARTLFLSAVIIPMISGPVWGLGAPGVFEERPARNGTVAWILDDLRLPRNPAAPAARRLIPCLERAGYRVEAVTGDSLSNLARVGDRLPEIGLLVLPDAPHFPLGAHRGLLLLLTGGVDLLAMGGYAFDAPVVLTREGFLSPPEPVPRLLTASATKVTLARRRPLRSRHGLIGDWRDGKWVTLETIPLTAGPDSVAFRIPDDLVRGGIVVTKE